jgi:MFS family permease
MSLYYNLAAVPGLFLSGWIIDKMPRIVLLRGSIVMAFLSLAVCALLALATKNAAALVAVSCLFNSCLTVCWASLSLITSESFPTCQRTGIGGMCTASGNLGYIAISAVSSLFLAHGFASGPLVLGSASLVCAILLTFVGQLRVEKGSPLRDSITVSSAETVVLSTEVGAVPVQVAVVEEPIDETILFGKEGSDV